MSQILNISSFKFITTSFFTHNIHITTIKRRFNSFFLQFSFTLINLSGGFKGAQPLYYENNFCIFKTSGLLSAGLNILEINELSRIRIVYSSPVLLRPTRPNA